MTKSLYDKKLSLEGKVFGIIILMKLLNYKIIAYSYLYSELLYFIIIGILGDESINVVNTLTDMGFFYESLCQYKLALDTYNIVLIKLKLIYDNEDKIEFSNTYTHLANVLELIGNIKQALDFYYLSLSVQNRILLNGN